MERKVVISAFLSRIILMSWVLVCDSWIPDYDSSNQLTNQLLDQLHPSSSLDHTLRHLLSPFSHWDGVYFVEIALNGYLYEHFFAFFPLLPSLIAMISAATASLWELFALGLRTRILLVGVLINLFAFVLAARELYSLAILLSKPSSSSGAPEINTDPVNRCREKQASIAALLFCVSPASVFLTAIYSESLYALFTFLAFRLMLQKRWILSAFSFSLTCAARSTGFTYLPIFVAHYLFFSNDHNINGSLSMLIKANLKGRKILSVLFLSAIILWPLLVFIFIGYAEFCWSSIAYHSMELRPWCHNRLPLIYDFVQSEYWGVGIFRYYRKEQIPNFLLASPMILITLSALVSAALFHLIPHSISSKTSNFRSNPTGIFLQQRSISLLLHWAFLFLVALLVLHVQVITRFMSASPALYLFGSWILTGGLDSDLHINAWVLSLPINSPLRLIGVAVRFLLRFVEWSLLFFFFAYFFIGPILFSNFLPWT